MKLKLIVTSLLCVATAACGDGTKGFPTPESGAQAFMQATADDDEYAIRAFTRSSASDPAYNIAPEEEPAPKEKIRTFRIRSASSGEQFATVDVDVELSDDSSLLRRILMVKTDKGWFVQRSAWVAQPAPTD